MDTLANTSYSVPAIQRAIAVLEILASSPAGISLADLARRTGYPKSSLFRILLALERTSVVRQDEERKVFTLGMKLVEWGNAALDRIDIKTVTRPHLIRLAHDTRESYYLAILDGYDVIIIDRVDTPEMWRIVARLGHRSPFHATASGQVLVADLEPEVIDRVMTTEGLKRFTDRTLTTRQQVKKRLAQVKRQGYAVADAEYKPDLCVIAAPIYDHNGRVPAAVFTALHSERVRRDRTLVRTLIDTLRKESNLISREIGWTGEPAMLPQDRRK